MNVDPVHNSYGVSFAVEPRFIPKSKIAQTSGTHIPVAGAFGLE